MDHDQRNRFKKMNSMNSYNKLSSNHSPFPSIFRSDSNAKTKSMLQNSALSYSSTLRDPFATHHGNIQNLHNAHSQSPLSPQRVSPPRTRSHRESSSNRVMSLLKWLINWFIDQIFSGYPIYIQAIICGIIGFIAYFLYDYAIFVDSVSSYIMYKAMSFLIFSISAFFLYILYKNIMKSDDSMINISQHSNSFNKIKAQNPYNNASSFHHQNSRSHSRQQSMSNLNNPYLHSNNNHKRDDLHFTKKSLLSNHRVNSGSFQTDSNKYDFNNSSPQKIASLNPSKIATQSNLNSFLAKQHKVGPTSNINTPMTGSSATNIGQSPIGKTFGSMGMTPAIMTKHRPVIGGNMFDTPKMNPNQGSAHNLYTPTSSNMDVTMTSYDHSLGGSANKNEPFPADFSIIAPNNKQAPAPTAWDVSGFGAAQSNNLAVDISTIAQMGTPAKNSGNAYNYDSMYGDINLRGDNIGQVVETQNDTFRKNMNVNAQQKKVQVNVTRKAPISPFSRQRNNVKHSTKTNKNALNRAVFTSMGIKKSQFAANKMEQSINLYQELRIDGLIANWAESMRWWLAEMVKTRCSELYRNDEDIGKVFDLLQNKYNLKNQLSQFQSATQRESFLLQNECQLLNVAKAENNPSIMHIVQKRKALKECFDFIVYNFRPFNDNEKVTEYVYDRIKTLSATNNLSHCKWNKGDDAKWQQTVLPNDAHLIMTLFCRYMDDAMCPAVKFSEKHFFQISIKEIKKIYKLHSKICDVAIICVSDMRYLQSLNDGNNNANGQNNQNNFYNDLSQRSREDENDKNDLSASDSLPYFFIAFDKVKFGKKMKNNFGQKQAFGQQQSLLKRPKHFLNSAWNSGANMVNDSFNNYFGNGLSDRNKRESDKENEDESDGVFGNKRKGKKQKNELVGTWFPEPGKNNLLHTVTLFALFIHRCCDGKLTKIGLKDQGCTLLEPILR